MAAADISKTVSLLRSEYATGRSRTRTWRVGQLNALRKLLREGENELCRAMNIDIGKSMLEGYLTELSLIDNEIQCALDNLDNWMKPQSVATNILNAPAQSYVQREPYGVALIMGAWNYPVQLNLLPMVGCIAAGNSCLVKVPSPKYTPETSKAMARLINKYMDPTLIQVAEGDRTVIAEVLAEKWDLIFFTGGEYLGKKVYQAAAQNLTPCLLELGGKNPCIVDDSADLNLAAKRIVWGSFMNCGQTCVRPDFVFVDAAVADKFMAKVKAQVIAQYSEDPQSTEWLGRLPNDAAFQRVSGLLEKDKAFVVQGGATRAQDQFIAPSVLDFGTNMDAFKASAVMQDEIFGPLLPVVRYDKLQTVLDFIKARDHKPLALYLFSGNSSVQKQFLNTTTSGALGMNDCVMQCANLSLPFGGVGTSGIGNYHGEYSFRCFSHEKAVMAKPNINALDIPLRYAPYGSLTARVLRLAQRPRPAWMQTLSVSAVLAGCFLLLAMALASDHKGLRTMLKTILQYIVDLL